MTNDDLRTAFAYLSTPLVTDAGLRLDVPVRLAPAGLRPIVAGTRLAGRVCPARHTGSVDVFLEALIDAAPGDVLVIDNGGRTDEACIGDLTALEAHGAGLAGLVVWGLHRDTTELRRLRIPVFSYGATPTGPMRLDPRSPDALTGARFGPFTVTDADVLFADDDGAVFAPGTHAEALLDTAHALRARERRQADALAGGVSLRAQFQFDAYLARRAIDPAYTFRTHLRSLDGTIEE